MKCDKRTGFVSLSETKRDVSSVSSSLQVNSHRNRQPWGLICRNLTQRRALLMAATATWATVFLPCRAGVSPWRWGGKWMNAWKTTIWPLWFLNVTNRKCVLSSKWRCIEMVSFQSTVKVRHTPKMACSWASAPMMDEIHMSSLGCCKHAVLQLNQFPTTFTST